MLIHDVKSMEQALNTDYFVEMKAQNVLHTVTRELASETDKGRRRCLFTVTCNSCRGLFMPLYLSTRARERPQSSLPSSLSKERR